MHLLVTFPVAPAVVTATGVETGPLGVWLCMYVATDTTGMEVSKLLEANARYLLDIGHRKAHSLPESKYSICLLFLDF